jgi:hypothetical protein
MTKMSNFLKKELEANNFQCVDISNEILSIENFLSKEELDTILKIIEKTPEEKWGIEYTKNLKRFCRDKFGRDDVENLIAEGKYEVTQNWGDKNLNINHSPIYRVIHSRLDDIVQKVDPNLQLSGFATLQRMQPGVELKPHTDQNTDPSIVGAAILYLNDDYTDGQLFFENFKIELKPKPGTLLLFPGNSEYEHGVRVVGPGPIRYVIVGFIKVKGFYMNNKY